jgi:hypothetical protein
MFLTSHRSGIVNLREFMERTAAEISVSRAIGFRLTFVVVVVGVARVTGVAGAAGVAGSGVGSFSFVFASLLTPSALAILFIPLVGIKFISKKKGAATKVFTPQIAVPLIQLLHTS